MKVWSNTFYSGDVIEILSYSREFFIYKLAGFFETKYYGKSVEEIFYIEVCEDPIFTPNSAGTTFYYGKRKKVIQLGIVLDFELVSTRV